MLVTEEQINQFHEDGAILLKNAFRKIALIVPNIQKKHLIYTNKCKIFNIFGTINQFMLQSQVGGNSKRWYRGIQLDYN